MDARQNTAEGSPAGERPAKRRARSALACQRCKCRKQRCDNQFPSCSSCLSAGEACSYGFKQIYPTEYVRSLENRIAELERGAAVANQTATTPGFSGIPVNENRHLSNDVVYCPGGDNVADDVESNAEAGSGIVALSPNSFLGTASGFPLAKLLKSTISVSGDPSQIGRSTSKGINSFAPHLTTPYEAERQTGPSVSHRMADILTEEVSAELIDAYYSRVHPKHPFLSKKKIIRLHKARANLVPAHQIRPSTENRTDLCDYAILHLVYAIGARYLQLKNDNAYPSPGEHYASALADAETIFAVQSLENLDAMLLLSIYQLRSPTGPGIWWMVGTTMRHCIDCGLHRRSNNISVLLDQRRKRIFWTAYMLERSLARTMGRPFSASDRDIDVELPANIDDSIDTETEAVTAIAEARANPTQITPLTAAIHIFRLQQLESKISNTVCRVDKPVSSINPRKITALRAALDEWKSNIPITHDYRAREKHPYVTNDYHMTQYHKALVLLFLPFLPSLTPAQPEFHQIAYSAGQICQLYKRLYDDQTYISFSLLALHANFVAGLVLVYCFCIDPSIFDSKFSSDIRACSTLLYTISERWPAARKVRNAFDRLVTVTVEGEHDKQSRRPRPNTIGRSMQIEAEQTLDNEGSRVSGNRANESIWDSFEMALEDYQISAETWMQDSIFQAMDAFPSEDWTR